MLRDHLLSNRTIPEAFLKISHRACVIRHPAVFGIEPSVLPTLPPARDTARAMSQENVEIVLRAMTSLLERDVEAWVACCATDVEVLLPRNLFEGGSYKGHEGLRRAFADVFETWEDIGFDLQGVREIEDRVVVLGRSTNVGRGEAPTVEYESAYLAQLRDGKIVYLRPYESRREALEAAGLRE